MIRFLGVFPFWGFWWEFEFKWFFELFLQEAETKAKIMEQEIGRLHVELEEKDEQLKTSATTATKVPLPTLFLRDFPFFFPLIGILFSLVMRVQDSLCYVPRLI